MKLNYFHQVSLVLFYAPSCVSRPNTATVGLTSKAKEWRLGLVGTGIFSLNIKNGNPFDSQHNVTKHIQVFSILGTVISQIPCPTVYKPQDNILSILKNNKNKQTKNRALTTPAETDHHVMKK